MQGTPRKQTYTARRRRSGRTPTKELKALSASAYKIGSASRRIYRTARLSVTPYIMARMSKVSRFFGISLSSTARRLLAIAEAINDKRPNAGARLFNYFEAKTIKGTRPKSRRKRQTAIDLWAIENAGQFVHASINLRLSAWNLAEIETKRQESELSGGMAYKYSRAFVYLIMWPLSAVYNLIASYERGALKGQDPEMRRKPTRVNRCRIMTEAKKRITERGCTAEL